MIDNFNLDSNGAFICDNGTNYGTCNHNIDMIPNITYLSY